MMHLELWKIIVAAVLVVFSFVVYRRTFPPISVVKRALLIAMRTGAFALLGLLLINPVFVASRVEVRNPLVVALIDRSLSMGIKDVGGTERLADAAGRLALLRRELQEKSEADLEAVTFADGLSGASVPENGTVRADGEGTDIWGALEAAQRKYRSNNLAAIVLLTDGRITRGMVTSGEDVAVPVYAVGFGDTFETADVSIEEVIYERTAYRGTKVPIEAVIRASGFRGKTLDVRLMEDGRIRDNATLSMNEETEILNALLDYVSENEGERRLSVEVVPVPGEERRENNIESFRIDVLKDKVRILFIDQFPDWNTTFVRNLVKRSKRLEVEAVSWTPESGFVVSPGEESWVFPSNAGALAGYDLVIVSDDAGLFSSRANAEVLGSYVRAGGSVLFLADENSPLGRGASFDLLQPFLPLQRAGTPRIDFAESFVRVSPEAFGDAVTSMLAEDGALDDLPPLPGRIVGVSPSTLARVPLVLEERRGSVPFFLLARHGEGLSSAILGFPLWRWRLAGDEGERIYESFFGSLVQYLADGAKASELELDADRTVYRAGDRVRFTVSIGERRIPEGIRGEVRGKSGGEVPVSTFVFEPDPKKRGIYRAEVDPLPPGEYAATASEVTLSGEGMTGTVSFSVLSVSVEFLRTSRDAAFLAQIAEATGGRYIEAAQLPALAAQLNLKKERVERREVHELRGNILLFIGIVACFAAEWILRKAWGLV